MEIPHYLPPRTSKLNSHRLVPHPKLNDRCATIILFFGIFLFVNCRIGYSLRVNDKYEAVLNLKVLNIEHMVQLS